MNKVMGGDVTSGGVRLCTRSALAFAALLTLSIVTPGSHVSWASTGKVAHSVCATSQLSISEGSSGVAAGHIGLSVKLKNISGTSCTLKGYPRIQMVGAPGHDLRTIVHRGSSYSVPDRQVRLVVLSPGASASFDLGFDDATGYGSDKCPESRMEEVTPPQNTTSLPWALRLDPFGGGTIQHLVCGEITVSPVYLPG